MPKLHFYLCVTQNALKREINWISKFKHLSLESLKLTFLPNLAGFFYEVSLGISRLNGKLS